MIEDILGYYEHDVLKKGGTLVSFYTSDSWEIVNSSTVTDRSS